MFNTMPFFFYSLVLNFRCALFAEVIGSFVDL